MARALWRNNWSRGVTVSTLGLQINSSDYFVLRQRNAFWSGKGLFWELNPGPLAPEVRIMPLDQTASASSERNFLASQLEADDGSSYRLKLEAKSCNCETSSPLA